MVFLPSLPNMILYGTTDYMTTLGFLPFFENGYIIFFSIGPLIHRLQE
jgi:hypothetical protein